MADDLEFQKIHDLVTLLKTCLSRRPVLIHLMPECRLLSRYYIDTRSPVHWPTDYTKDKASLAQAAAGTPLRLTSAEVVPVLLPE